MKWYKSIRSWYLIRKYNRAIRILDNIDWQLKDLGWTRHERRRFWREYTKSQARRTDVLNQITAK